MVYLDYAATTPVNKEVLESFTKVSKDFFGNPSSMHNLGTKASSLLDQSRDRIKLLLNSDHKVIFTSGATESNNLAIKGIISKYKNRGNHIITSAIEHPSVLETIKSLDDVEVTYLTPENGVITKAQVMQALRDDTVLVSLMHVNNEVGNINEIQEIADYLKEGSNAYFHVDATQSIGKLPLSLENIDLVSFSAHKIFGLKGSGALLIKYNLELDSQIKGGSQEFGLRAGTENLANVVSLTKALRLVYEKQEESLEHVTKLNKLLREQLLSLELPINSSESASPYILNFSLDKINSETMLHFLEEKDIYVSTTSACSSKDSTRSEVVFQLTNDEQKASHALRISLSHLTSTDDIIEFIEKLKEGLNSLK